MGFDPIARCVFGLTQVITRLIILSLLKQLGPKQKVALISGIPILGFQEVESMVKLSPILYNNNIKKNNDRQPIICQK
jgi:hypothetical protein